jgi:hypothetical protein
MFKMEFTCGDEQSPGESHHDALVITLSIGNCQVSRVMVDNGSSVNLMTKQTLEDMGFTLSDLVKKSVPLVGFSGETAHTLGEIYIPTYAKGINLHVKYLIIDCMTSYTVILGRPWLHAMKAVPSTYHQSIKFPTPWGVQEILGDQRDSRECYGGMLKKALRKPSA